MIQDQYCGIPDYNGHDLNVIMQLFPKLACFSVSQDSVISGDIDRMTGSYAARSYTSGPLNLYPDTREAIANLFESGNDHIPFNLILQGLMSFSWSYFFLELYRCLEQLYPVPRLKSLSEEFTLQRSLKDLALAMERLLSWRPKEDESLEKIIRMCEISSIENSIRAFSCDISEASFNKTDVLSRSIYRLRNNLVHFRASKEHVDFDDRKWNSIINAMISLIMDAYNTVGEAYNMPYRSSQISSRPSDAG